MKKIAFVEDDIYFAKALQQSILLQPNLICNLHAKSIEDFWIKLPTRANFDIIFLDISLPGQSGVEAIPNLRKRFPQTEIIMLTLHEDTNLLFQALHSGANGYLNKDFSIVEFPQILKNLLNGGALLSPKMARKLIQHFNPSSGKSKARDLTAKEMQILSLLSQGFSYNETADAMGIGIDGVRYHIRNIYRTLNVSSKIEAINHYKTIVR